MKNTKSKSESEELQEIIAGQIHVAQDFEKDAWAQGFFSMHGNGGFPSVGVLDAVMTAFDFGD